MAKRTISDFRGEKHIWRKDLADRLGISEHELYAIELSEEVPDEIGKKIIGLYGLANDYFTFDPEARELRYMPKYRFLYLFAVSLIWALIFATLREFVYIPARVALYYGTESVTMFRSMALCFSAVICACSGIYLTSFIGKKTSFPLKIRRYDLIYPYFAAATVSFLIPSVTAFSEHTAGSGRFRYLALQASSLIIKALFTASLLYISAVLKNRKQRIGLIIICLIPLVSYGIYAGLTVSPAKDVTSISSFETALACISVPADRYGSGLFVISVCERVISFFLLAFTAFMTSYLSEKKTRYDTILFTAIPLCGMLAPAALGTAVLFI